jgi:hypothetical protein
MQEKIKTLKEGYYKPTPVKWRKIGDAIQDVAIIGGAVLAMVVAPPAWIPVAIMVIGRIGKIITNFATE